VLRHTSATVSRAAWGYSRGVVIDLPPDLSLVIETPRLRVVPLNVDPARDLFPLFNDEELYRYTTRVAPSEDQLESWIERWRERRSPDGYEVWLNWVIRVMPMGEPVGHIQAAIYDDHCAEISFMVGTDYQNRGFAREAVRATAKVMRAHLGIERLRGRVHPENVAAKLVALELDMAPLGQVDGGGHELWAGMLE
jgi:RimJ/RimL family protein N-acetyltransferase